EIHETAEADDLAGDPVQQRSRMLHICLELRKPCPKRAFGRADALVRPVRRRAAHSRGGRTWASAPPKGYFSNSHATFFNTRSTRSINCRMSFFACAAEKKAASSCDGGR